MIKTAIAAAKQAGEILLKHHGQIDLAHVDTKNPSDFVTHVDKKSEQIIIEVIKSDFPDHKIYAEESAKDTRGGYRWIIDPLDGTTNYMHGFPVFSVSIALEFDDEIVLGVVFDPTRNELYVAEQGQGSTCNGKKICVSQVQQPELALLVSGFPFRSKKFIDLYQQSFNRLFLKVAGIRRLGSAALDFCHIAAGRSEGFWEIGLSPWDVAAGYVLVKEAGGKITDFVGGPNAIWDGNVIASNGHLHPLISKVVKDVFKGKL
ncbi:inositol monophosphatase [candidate division KSB1 bacterium]|nr:inositol monophosphatase [candidate division KSB1 bacterium]